PPIALCLWGLRLSRGSLAEAEDRARDRINTPPNPADLHHRVNRWINRGAQGQRRETVYHAFRLHPQVMVRWLLIDGFTSKINLWVIKVPMVIAVLILP